MMTEFSKKIISRKLMCKNLMPIILLKESVEWLAKKILISKRERVRHQVAGAKTVTLRGTSSKCFRKVRR